MQAAIETKTIELHLRHAYIRSLKKRHWLSECVYLKECPLLGQSLETQMPIEGLDRGEEAGTRPAPRGPTYPAPSSLAWHREDDTDIWGGLQPQQEAPCLNLNNQPVTQCLDSHLRMPL